MISYSFGILSKGISFLHAAREQLAVSNRFNIALLCLSSPFLPLAPDFSIAKISTALAGGFGDFSELVANSGAGFSI